MDRPAQLELDSSVPVVLISPSIAVGHGGVAVQ